MMFIMMIFIREENQVKNKIYNFYKKFDFYI